MLFAAFAPATMPLRFTPTLVLRYAYAASLRRLLLQDALCCFAMLRHTLRCFRRSPLLLLYMPPAWQRYAP